MDLTHPDLEFAPHGDILVIRFMKSKFDSSNLDTISECMAQLVEEQEYSKFVLNLKELSYIFSDAIGQLVGFQTKVEAAGGAIRFCCLHQDIAAILNVLKLLDHLNFTEDEAAAISELS